MFFVASKLLGLVFEPVNFLILASLFGLILCLTPWARVGRIMSVSAALLFVVLAFSPSSALLLRTLEDRFPQPPDTMPAPAGIVVLGGSIDADLGEARGQPIIGDAATRLTAGVALARAYPKARLVFTGGNASVRQKGLDEATAVHELWTSLGVPEAQMTFEDRSRNTYENATLTKALVQPKAGDVWLLVTSAAHMPRSMGIFRKVGWAMTAYPVDYHTYGDSRDWHPSLSAINSLHRLDTALHEWIGLVAYRLTGKTNALFPAP